MGFTPQKSINFIVGSLRTHGVGASSYRTNDDYIKFIMNYDVFGVGKLYAEYRYENIQDNIRDKYIRVKISRKEYGNVWAGGKQFDRDLFFDELEYKNSKVQRLWLDSIIRALPSITLENHIKLESNNQVEEVMYDRSFQPHDVLNTYAIMNKIAYTKRFGNWVFSPGVKFRFYKKARSESLQPLDHYMMRMPLVMLKYIVSPRTDIALGMQGIPGFELDYNDYVQTHNDYKEKTYCLQIQNRTNYFGYNVWAAVGVNLEEMDYQESYRKVESYKSSGTFVKVFIGWD